MPVMVEDLRSILGDLQRVIVPLLSITCVNNEGEIVPLIHLDGSFSPEETAEGVTRFFEGSPKMSGIGLACYGGGKQAYCHVSFYRTIPPSIEIFGHSAYDDVTDFDDKVRIGVGLLLAGIEHYQTGGYLQRGRDAIGDCAVETAVASLCSG